MNKSRERAAVSKRLVACYGYINTLTKNKTLALMNEFSMITSENSNWLEYGARSLVIDMCRERLTTIAGLKYLKDKKRKGSK